jgi:hypothetical protein
VEGRKGSLLFTVITYKLPNIVLGILHMAMYFFTKDSQGQLHGLDL